MRARPLTEPRLAVVSAAPEGEIALSTSARALAYTLCACAGIAEGLGLNSGGMAAPGFAVQFHLTPEYVGVIFLLTSLGLALGASVGGWWGDRVGAGRAMGASIALFAVASIGSALAWNGGALLTMRTLTGLGLGGSLPNMITLLTYVGPREGAARRVTLSIAAISLGSLVIALIVMFGPASVGWQLLFQICGWFSLLTAVAIALLLPRVRTRRGWAVAEVAERGGRWLALFGSGRLLITLLLWLAFFITAGTSYLLINWMPTFLVRSGLNHHGVGLGMIGLAVGGAAGPLLLAGLLRPGRSRSVISAAYLGIVLGLLSLIYAPNSAGYLCFAIAFTGFFTAGTQALLFGMVGPFYPATARGTGVGSAVAVGRIGSGVGPALAGVMLTAGLTQGEVMAAAVPLILLSLAAMLVLLRRAPEELQSSAHRPS